jgi:multiple sugar transport system permease protein
VTAFNDGHMLSAVANTAFILVLSVTGTVFIGSMTAYAVDRFRFRFRKVVVSLFLIAALVPNVTTQVATFQVVDAMGLLNTRWAPTLLYMGTDIVSIYIFIQFIHSIPVELDEAARLDGASSLTIYWRIILPLLRPAIATVVIIKGIFVYNDFYIPFLYMPSPDLGVISTSLFRFKGPFGAHWEAISAGAVLVIVPTLILFLALQRFIYSGFTEGATK